MPALAGDADGVGAGGTMQLVPFQVAETVPLLIVEQEDELIADWAGRLQLVPSQVP